MVPDDALDIRMRMSRREHERGAVLPDVLVLVQGRLEPVRARCVRAFADELRAVGFEALSVSRSALVDIAEEGLGAAPLPLLVHSSPSVRLRGRQRTSRCEGYARAC